MKQRDALVQIQAKTAVRSKTYPVGVNGYVSIVLVCQLKHGVARFYIGRQHKAVGIKITDLRRGQVHRFHLQGVVGNGAAKFGKPAEQRALHDRGVFPCYFGQDYGIVCGIIARVPAIHHTFYLAAADGYRVAGGRCTAPATHILFYPASTDGHRVAGGRCTAPAYHTSFHRTAADINCVTFSVFASPAPADNSSSLYRSIVFAYRTADNGHDVAFSGGRIITIPAINLALYCATIDGHGVTFGRIFSHIPTANRSHHRAAADNYVIFRSNTKTAFNPTAIHKTIYCTTFNLCCIILHHTVGIIIIPAYKAAINL